MHLLGHTDLLTMVISGEWGRGSWHERGGSLLHFILFWAVWLNFFSQEDVFILINKTLVNDNNKKKKTAPLYHFLCILVLFPALSSDPTCPGLTLYRALRWPPPATLLGTRSLQGLGRSLLPHGPEPTSRAHGCLSAGSILLREVSVLQVFTPQAPGQPRNLFKKLTDYKKKLQKNEQKL